MEYNKLKGNAPLWLQSRFTNPMLANGASLVTDVTGNCITFPPGFTYVGTGSQRSTC